MATAKQRLEQKAQSEGWIDLFWNGVDLWGFESLTDVMPKPFPRVHCLDERSPIFDYSRDLRGTDFQVSATLLEPLTGSIICNGVFSQQQERILSMQEWMGVSSFIGMREELAFSRNSITSFFFPEINRHELLSHLSEMPGFLRIQLRHVGDYGFTVESVPSEFDCHFLNTWVPSESSNNTWRRSKGFLVKAPTISLRFNSLA